MSTLVTERRFAAMGTRVHVIVVGGSNDLAFRAGERIDELEQRWSRFRADSEVSALNASAGSELEVSHDTWVLVSKACQAWRLSRGAFDPTVATAMDANGYDRPFAELISAPAVAVRPPQATPGCGEIELDDRRRSIRLPQGVRIDPGGIGKGLAADMVAAEIMRAGAAGVLVNIGGDMVALGQPPEGDTWAVVVDEPTVCPMPLTTVTLDRGALATSVTTRRRWATDDGDRHHLIDPRTGGSTAAEIVLVSALACEGWLAEIATKAHMVGRVSPALASVPALVLHADGRLEAHAGFHEHMADLDLAPAPLEEVLT